VTVRVAASETGPKQVEHQPKDQFVLYVMFLFQFGYDFRSTKGWEKEKLD